ncbi:hypothetical protein ACFE04_004703 [Oxalis oulophora]
MDDPHLTTIGEDDKEALAGLTPAPPPPTTRKVYSYSHQLRTSQKKNRHHAHHKHSLEDIPKLPINDGDYFDSSDDDLFPSSSSTPNNNQVGPGPGPDESINVSVNVGQRADQSVCNDGGNDDREFQPLPEFIAGGGGVGIFKVPTRAAVHPGRPTCLELRPHPLRETQVGKFLRNIVCTQTQLWAGQENGVRVWKFEDAYEPGNGLGGRVRRGDEDAAPFHESLQTSPTTCLMVDHGNKLVWSGHKDGKIRSWKMNHPVEDNELLKEGLSWNAHKGPVNSIIMSSYGDMWTGSDGGNIKIWPWESIEKSLSLSPEEKHMAALLVERSFIDLRSQVTVNGSCRISSSEVKCLMSDHVRAKVWCVQPLSFSLWDARSKELLKVFNVEGQIENRVDMGQQQTASDQQAEDEMKVKFVSTSKKEKSGGFLQRSRNAIMGAADAVRRVATKGAGAFVDDAKKTEALVLSPDGSIWSGSANGMLVQWDSTGNRLQDVTHHPVAVQCFCTFGTRIYIGYITGIIQVMDLDGTLIAGWVSHSSPVIKLAVGDGLIFSLATHGGIRGWNVTSPGPVDAIFRTDLAAKEQVYARRDSFRILMGTWNVGQGKPVMASLKLWLGSVSSDIGIIVVGLQEVDMGAGFLAMSAAKETVGLEGSAAGNLWLDAIGKAVDEKGIFERMGSRQLAGLLIGLWVRKSLRTHVGDVDAGAVPCGFGRAIGNKGGVGLRIRVHDRIICFVNCHLAAHLEAVNRRNADFDHIYRNMVFSRSLNLTNNSAAGVSTTAQVLKSQTAPGANNTEETRPELCDADMVIFIGDFNYRLFGITYDEARDFVSQRCFDWLRERDQLRAEMKAGKAFQGMREAIIRFPPTYKFERGRPGLGGYDSREKKRIPAWCDRVIYRDNRAAPVGECGLDCPLVTAIYLYEAVMEVCDSDHKPVRCKLHVQIAHVDRSVRRQAVGEIAKSNEQVKAILDELRNVPETTVSTDNISLQNQDTAVVKITNKSGNDKAIFKIICEGQATVKEDDGDAAEYRPRGSCGLPRWLEITPAAGVIKPDSYAEVSIHHEEFHTLEEFVDGIPQNWWCEDTRDKEVALLVIIEGSCSTETTTHRIIVRHCFSAKAIRINSKSNGSRKNMGGSQHRSDH